MGRSLCHKARKYLSLERTNCWLLLEASTGLGCASLLLACVPFRHIAQWLGRPGGEDSPNPPPAEEEIARQVGWAVEKAARHLPWESRCLAQALAGWWMLGRRRIGGVLYFGVAREEGKAFCAHAWLRCGTRIVTGGEGHEKFRVIATFAARGGGENIE